MSIADFLYYTVLKKGKLIIIILGIFLFILVVLYTSKFGTNVSEITKASLKECTKDNDCFFYCDDCYSIKPTEHCKEEPSEIPDCVCLNNKCQIA